MTTKADEELLPALQRELAFYFGAYHGTSDHVLNAASCMENDCVRVRTLLNTRTRISDEAARANAERIADDLFGDADRLVLAKQGELTGMGGWGKVVVVDRITDLLTKGN